MLVITLLIFSVALNIALIFGIVRKNADEDMDIIRLREGLDVQDLEYFRALQTKIR